MIDTAGSSAFELRRTWLDDPNAAVDTGSCGADLSVSFTE
jgi:hypothetical protein